MVAALALPGASPGSGDGVFLLGGVPLGSTRVGRHVLARGAPTLVLQPCVVYA